jgi:hypothetical protein
MNGSTIARFLFSGHCTPTRVKENAFLPPPNLSLSVAIADGLQESAAREIALTYLEKPDRPCKGYATIPADCIVAESLSITRDDEPYIRHAVVEGWPPDKPRQKAIAQRLAQKSALHSFQ